MLPMNVCNHIDKMVRNFIWGGNKSDVKKIHLINWQTVTKPKAQGGLGLKEMHKMNISFMAKLRWQLLTKKGSLWAMAHTGKYVRRYQLDQIDKEARLVTQLERHTLGDRPALKGDKSQGLKW